MQNRDGWKYIHRGQVHCQTVVATQRRVGTIYKNRDPRAPPSNTSKSPPLSKRTQKRLGMLHEGYPHMLLNNVHHHRAFSQHGRNCREGPTSRSPAHGRSTQHAQSDKRSTSPSKRSRVDETVLPDLNTAWVTENFQLASRMTMSFRPYGNPSPFDLDEYKDSFESWEIQWYLSYQLRHIITC